jgi:hypothetical protein
MPDERHDAFSSFIRSVAIRQARVLAQCPPVYEEVECPGCDAWFTILHTGYDQVADCPECGKRWAISYDAEMRESGLWHGRYVLRRLRAAS